LANFLIEIEIVSDPLEDTKADRIGLLDNQERSD